MRTKNGSVYRITKGEAIEVGSSHRRISRKVLQEIVKDLIPTPKGVRFSGYDVMLLSERLGFPKDLPDKLTSPLSGHYWAYQVHPGYIALGCQVFTNSEVRKALKLIKERE